MRLLTVMLLTVGVSGCGHLSPEAAGDLVGAVFSVAATAIDIAQEEERRRAEAAEEEAPAPPTGIRGSTVGPDLACHHGHSLHLRCVQALFGKICFWETDEGATYECSDAECRTIPAALAAWCY